MSSPISLPNFPAQVHCLAVHFILGRTIKAFIMHCMTIPVVYSFLWMSIFGGAGLKMERNAYWANITCNSTFGGKTSSEPGPNGLYRLSCRYEYATQTEYTIFLNSHFLKCQLWMDGNNDMNQLQLASIQNVQQEQHQKVTISTDAL